MTKALHSEVGVRPSAIKHLSTQSVPERERFAYWIDAICRVYVGLDGDTTEDAQRVHGDVRACSLGPLVVTDLCSSQLVVRRTPSLISASADDCVLVHVQHRGSTVIAQDNRQCVLGPGDFAIYDSSRPYELRCDADAHHTLVIRHPKAQLLQHVANLEDLTATLIPAGHLSSRLLHEMLAGVLGGVEELTPGSASSFAESMTCMAAAGLRGLPAANQRRGSNLSSFHIARVKAFVNENLRDPDLSVCKIAAAMHMSSDHLSRLFRHEPLQLSRLIARLRLEACRRDLVDPRLKNHSISEIAFGWAFSDAANFSRAFREQFGMSPREWRSAGPD
ncbi:AraC family transcriptional regulator [Caballeronia fortuita]|uniref:AraC family transcriptional regulator n=1 Tax=Caballeronia fortuita TaxID=1777138 RepID=A0A158CCB2_9BURK|nr:AraC family transcriptional regulator [Caballeronia fortuita]